MLEKQRNALKNQMKLNASYLDFAHFVNFSSRVLTEPEKSLLCKGFKFAIPPRKLKVETTFTLLKSYLKP